MIRFLKISLFILLTIVYTEAYATYSGVQYEAKDDLLTVKVEQLQLGELLKIIHNKTGIIFRTNGNSLTQKLSFNIHRVVLEKAVKSILKNYSSIISYNKLGKIVRISIVQKNGAQQYSGYNGKSNDSLNTYSSEEANGMEVNNEDMAQYDELDGIIINTGNTDNDGITMKTKEDEGSTVENMTLFNPDSNEVVETIDIKNSPETPDKTMTMLPHDSNRKPADIKFYSD